MGLAAWRCRLRRNGRDTRNEKEGGSSEESSKERWRRSRAEKDARSCREKVETVVRECVSGARVVRRAVVPGKDRA